MASPSPDRKQPLILIVDDTRTLRQMGREALEEVGLDVLEAADGEEGLRAFDRQRPDLVLLDVNMPARDGYSVCEEIRRHAHGRNTPVLMITASDDVKSIHRAYEVGATDFTTKPVNWTILCQRIRYMLRMSQVVVDLHTSQARLAKAQRTARLGNWELDLRSGEIVCSEELRRLYGLPASDGPLAVRDVVSRVHPDDRELLQNAVERSVAEGSALDFDHRVHLANGEERFIHVQADVVFDEDARPVELSGTAQDVSDRKRAEQEIRFLAYHDGLTRLGNGRLFTERLHYALAQAKRHETVVGVLFLDLDHFKRINDMFGHATGDLFLRRVADRLKNSVRESDCVSRALDADLSPMVSRFGGDEFMISLCSVDSQQEAGEVAQRILDTLTQPFSLDCQEVVISASIGIAVFPRDGEDVDSLICNADAAMYHAKRTGRGGYQFYESSMNAVAKEDLKLEGDLRRALNRGELRVHYQPKVSLSNGRITGFEALARWSHPELGMVSPETFVPLAERAGLIAQLGESVLRQACAQLKAWREQGLPPLRMSVNLSAHQFRTEEIADLVARVVKQTPISPRFLDVEITETAMMHNKQITIEALQKMKGTGITVSLDDFGTGYSSLSYLKGFPVDTVKIDRSFIREITTDPDDAAITAAIISMAKALNLKVVAEGVETEEQLAFLRAHGCDEMQGYLFSPPLPPEEATAFLREKSGASGSTPDDE